MAETGSWTVGRYLAARLTQVGINDYFVVPGDYNLVLLDEFLSDERLRMICLLYTSPSPRDQRGSRMPSSA